MQKSSPNQSIQLLFPGSGQFCWAAQLCSPLLQHLYNSSAHKSDRIQQSHTAGWDLLLGTPCQATEKSLKALFQSRFGLIKLNCMKRVSFKNCVTFICDYSLQEKAFCDGRDTDLMKGKHKSVSLKTDLAKSIYGYIRKVELLIRSGNYLHSWAATSKDFKKIKRTEERSVPSGALPTHI